jgi:hypothetical protein
LSKDTFHDHPIQLISEIRERWPEASLSFSHYFYRPQSPFDERRVFEQKAAEVTPDWLHVQLQKLPDGWDIALNSSVKDARGRLHHLPMIDFTKRLLVSDDLILMRSILGISLYSRFVFFDSGRSLHAYGVQILSPGQWREFMGRLLLLNLPRAEPLIDNRWVGHRLVSGYSALRWSSNASHYVKQPARVNIDLANPGRVVASSSDGDRAPLSR